MIGLPPKETRSSIGKLGAGRSSGLERFSRWGLVRGVCAKCTWNGAQRSEAGASSQQKGRSAINTKPSRHAESVFCKGKHAKRERASPSTSEKSTNGERENLPDVVSHIVQSRDTEASRREKAAGHWRKSAASNSGSFF